MIKIHPKTLSDLEFHTVCAQLSELCITDMGKVKALKLAPQRNYRKTLFVLDQTQEYINSDTHETPIPNHGFDALDHELKMLGIEDTVLEVGSFRKIGSLSETVNTHLRYFRKFQETFPILHQTVRDTEYTTELTDEINTIVDRFGEIKDDASPVLLQTRRAINEVKAKINSSFASALSRYASFGYLDEIRESIVDNVRVLAVSAMHRRKVKGSILGNSKTGSIVYIQPEATQTHQREQQPLI